MKNCLLLFLSALLPFTSCSNSGSENASKIIRPVKTKVVQKRNVYEKIFSGITDANDNSKLAFKVGGQILDFPVSSGEYVRKGQLIASIDPSDLRLQYSADKAAYETAKAEIERNKRLLERQAISKQDYEISVANYEKAKSAYELSSNNLENVKLTAPFDGTIKEAFADNYQRVEAGQVIVELINTDNLKVKFTMPDNYIFLLKNENKSFSVTFDNYKNVSFNAVLKEYVDVSYAGTGIPVKIVIDDPKYDNSKYLIKPGFTCSIKFVSDFSLIAPEGVISIPMSAVFGDPQNNDTYVWVVKDNKVKKRKVEIKDPYNVSDVVVTSGLQDNEVVVTAGVYQLREGQEVKLL